MENKRRKGRPLGSKRRGRVVDKILLKNLQEYSGEELKKSSTWHQVAKHYFGFQKPSKKETTLLYDTFRRSPGHVSGETIVSNCEKTDLEQDVLEITEETMITDIQNCAERRETKQSMEQKTTEQEERLKHHKIAESNESLVNRKLSGKKEKSLKATTLVEGMNSEESNKIRGRRQRYVAVANIGEDKEKICNELQEMILTGEKKELTEEKGKEKKKLSNKKRTNKNGNNFKGELRSKKKFLTKVFIKLYFILKYPNNKNFSLIYPQNQPEITLFLSHARRH